MSAELPPAGRSTPAGRTDARTPDASGTNLTVAEAVERYGMSERTVRRHLAAGRYAGAYMEPSEAGERWRIPLAALEQLHTVHADRIEEDAGTVTAGQAELIEELRARIELLERINAGHLDALEHERKMLTAGTVIESELRERTARQEAELRELTAELAAARAVIEERQRQEEQRQEAAGRRWWNRRSR